MGKRPRKNSKVSKRKISPMPPTPAAMERDRERVPGLLEDLYKAEYRAVKAERALALLKHRLVRLLNSDQVDAANTCGIEPELYAVEVIEIYKEKFFPHTPPQYRPLAAVTRT